MLNVHDGDTLTVMCDQHTDAPRKLKVRLYCIDAPELQQEPWGKASRDHLRELLASNPVTIRVKTHDRYGRTVGEVWQGKRNVDMRMVQDGDAAVYRKYCTDAEYIETERLSQSKKLGIWLDPGLQQRPWEWRHPPAP